MIVKDESGKRVGLSCDVCKARSLDWKPGASAYLDRGRLLKDWLHLGACGEPRDNAPIRGDLCPSCAAVVCDYLLERGFGEAAR